MLENEKEWVNIFETDWYKQICTTLTPGDAMRAYRENFGLSPTELAQKLGTTGETIVHMECNQCDINQELVQKLSELFEVPVERFL